jgi:DNA-binding transcriptional regulator GbsR (MarR family)
MKTQLETMVVDCERSLLSGQFQFSEEWLDNFILAAKDYMKAYNENTNDYSDEVEELTNKLKRAKKHLNWVYDALADVASELDY